MAHLTLTCAASHDSLAHVCKWHWPGNTGHSPRSYFLHIKLLAHWHYISNLWGIYEHTALLLPACVFAFTTFKVITGSLKGLFIPMYLDVFHIEINGHTSSCKYIFKSCTSAAVSHENFATNGLGSHLVESCLAVLIACHTLWSIIVVPAPCVNTLSCLWCAHRMQ